MPSIVEYVLGIDLPNKVFDDPALMRMYVASIDMLCRSNDVYSYYMEQAKGHTGNNIVTVLMNVKKCSLQEASDYVGLRFEELMDTFAANKQKLRSWGPAVDEAVAGYVTGLENWVVGNLKWSLETQRAGLRLGR